MTAAYADTSKANTVFRVEIRIKFGRCYARCMEMGEENTKHLMKKRILITGGAGFIGSHVVRLFVVKYPDYEIVNLDALTYAGNLENLKDIQDFPNYKFVRIDISDADAVDDLFDKNIFDGVIHLAAESHVDRSISDPLAFVRTNVIGTVNLLNACKKQWQGKMDTKRFYHISTDEVYGTLGREGLFTETTPYDPNSPYSASKASSDHFVRAYGETYGLPYVLTNCSNNYGPNQFQKNLFRYLYITLKRINLYLFMAMASTPEIGYML